MWTYAESFENMWLQLSELLRFPQIFLFSSQNCLCPPILINPVHNVNMRKFHEDLTAFSWNIEVASDLTFHNNWHSRQMWTYAGSFLKFWLHLAETGCHRFVFFIVSILFSMAKKYFSSMDTLSLAWRTNVNIFWKFHEDMTAFEWNVVVATDLSF